MNTVWYAHVGWIVAAGLLGFVITLIFSALLRLSGDIFLIPYIGFTLLFLFAYIRWSGLSIQTLILDNWVWGVIGAGILGIVTIRNVLSQPSSPHSQGFKLAFDLLWSGFLYGLTDGLLLSVFPVIAVWQAFSQSDWTANCPEKSLCGY